MNYFQDENSTVMGKDIEFVNLLPLRVIVYAFRINKLDIIGIVEGRGGKLVAKSTKSGMMLKGKDEIHITYRPGGNKGPEYEILEPITLVEDVRTIRIGDVVYEDKTNTLVQRSHSDISGIRVHNKVSIPVRIYYKGLRLAHIHRNDGTSFQSGSAGSVYLNNDTKGFNIGDKLDLRFVFSTLWAIKDGVRVKVSPEDGRVTEIPWCSVTIQDNYMSDMYLGVVNQHVTQPIQDMYSYRAGSPNVSGLKYLIGNKAYESIR